MKRVLLTLLVALVVVSAIAVPASAASQFSDVDGTPYSTAIDNLAAMGVVGGYDDGTFRPDNTLWRAQYAKMTVLALGYPVSEEDVSPFSDTPPASVGDPLYPGSYAAVAAENHIILGYPDGTFRFFNDLARQQAISIIVRAAGSSLDDPPAGWEGVLDYSDPAHGENIKKAEYNGLLDGIVDLASWDTTANATRGESAQLLSNLRMEALALTVVGPSGTKVFSMTDLKAMPSVEGQGGYKNKVGTIVGPDPNTGVSLTALLAEVGGLPEGCGIKVIATDGYANSFTHAQVVDGDFPMYDPTTGNPITTITGSLQMILAYALDGNPLDPGIAPLRVALVSPAAEQVTDSKYWAKMVARIEVTVLEVQNGDTVKTYTMSELMAMTAAEGYGGTKNKTGTIAGPDLYKGVSVLDLLTDAGGLAEGSGVKVTAGDGYSTTFTHDEVTNPVFPMYAPVTGDPITEITGALQMIVAYAQNGASLSADNGPLRTALVSPASEQVTDSGKWVRGVVKLEAVTE